MKLAPKHIAIMNQHMDVKNGSFVWHGTHEGDTPIVIINGEKHDAREVARAMGIKISKKYKYTERVEHAGMGESHAGGDTPDVGDGISQSQE